MTWLLWQQQGGMRIASPRRVLRASEVPALADANALCAKLAELERDERLRVEAAASQAAAAAHAKALEEGRAAARDELAAALASLGETAHHERERLRGEVAALALQVVRKVLGNFADDEVLCALAETAARDATPAPPLVLVVHEDVCDAVRERLAGRDEWEVRGDAACARDTCRIETEHGSVDASLNVQLERIEQAWRQP
jgi:flagellar biosynthesis/type III secretory pathway protein FliH